jgi:hypothetical protein
MNRQITKKQYVIIDMIILALVLCVLEAASRWALDFFRREIFTISIVLPMTLIAMMRHGAVGTALAALGGAVYCMLNHAQAGIYIVYIVGNMFIAANLLWFRNSGKQKVVQSKGRIALYVLTGYLLINLGRSVMAAAMGYPDIIAVAVRYFTTDALSAVMAFIILLIAKKQDGVFEDQTEYLKRQADKEEKGYAG